MCNEGFNIKFDLNEIWSLAGITCSSVVPLLLSIGNKF